ncbi:nucleotidyltransferase domain-containing protein [Sulfurovum sp.]|uniref:nucleotidyltransferase family protein n=1 Tax=Sulfurovum sp. TaxID=1969726 RepID=UPI0025E1AB5F|nr:nucleotidyltransferase domain-containing protein [Sulfurovum sp.]
MTKKDILQTLQQQENFMKKEFGVEKIGLFGSYAKGKQTESSDIDFYVEFRKKTFDNLAGLWVYLETLFHKKVDILHKHSNSNSVILNSIQKEVVYGQSSD